MIINNIRGFKVKERTLSQHKTIKFEIFLNIRKTIKKRKIKMINYNTFEKEIKSINFTEEIKLTRESHTVCVRIFSKLNVVNWEKKIYI